MKLDYIRLLVLRFDECFRFYRDIMDFQVTWGKEGDNYASFKVSDSTNLSIFKRELLAEIIGTNNLPSDVIAQDSYVLIFGVENVDDVIQRLRMNGANIILKPTDNPRWGIRIAYIRDPDGNLLEVNSPLQIEQWSDELREELEDNRQDA